MKRPRLEESRSLDAGSGGRGGGVVQTSSFYNMLQLGLTWVVFGSNDSGTINVDLKCKTQMQTRVVKAILLTGIGGN